MFYVAAILFDRFQRKDGKYYPKMHLEKIFHNFFWKNMKKLPFGALEVPPKI